MFWVIVSDVKGWIKGLNQVLLYFPKTISVFFFQLPRLNGFYLASKLNSQVVWFINTNLSCIASKKVTANPIQQANRKIMVPKGELQSSSINPNY